MALDTFSMIVQLPVGTLLARRGTIAATASAAAAAISGTTDVFTSRVKALVSRIPDRKLRDLIAHFSKYRLRNEDFEFPDLLGAAYEYLIGDFADSGRKEGR